MPLLTINFVSVTVALFMILRHLVYDERGAFDSYKINLTIYSDLKKTYDCTWRMNILLFAIKFNEVVNTIPSSVRCSLYVDDLALYVRGARLPCMVHQLQLAVDRVISWCSEHSFKFSTSKTKSMLLRKSPQRRGRL